jgi:hypothetical protein
MSFNSIIVNTGYFVLIINTVLFSINYLKKEKAVNYFIMYLLLCFFVQIYSGYLNSLNEHNLFLTHYFFIGQFIFLSLFFSTIINFKKAKNIIKFSIVIIPIIFAIYFYYYPETYKIWNIPEIIVTSIPLLFYSYLFIRKNMNYNKSERFIYFNAGFFVYTLCSTLIFILGNIGTKEIKSYAWLLNATLYLLFQSMIFIEWYKNFKKPIN